MIFVVEGPDGAGKSTLIKAIRAQAKSREVQCHFLSSSGPPRTITHIQNELDWLTGAPGSMNLFCDRHRMISEPIYGLTLRGYTTLDDRPFTRPRFIANVFIYCRPPIDVIKTNLASHPQLARVHETIGDIIEAYDNFFQFLEDETSFAVMRYDYTTTWHDEFLSAIFDRCNP